MTARRKIKTPQSPDLVTTKVLVDGSEVSAAFQLFHITVEKEINRIPFAQLIYRDGEASTQDFELSNEPLFAPGKQIEIKAGYHNDEETIFKGIVIKHSIKIRENGSALIVECRDISVKMTIGRKSNYFYDSKDSEIFENIVSNYSIEIDTEPTAHTHKEIVQYQSSDWDFIVTRAQANSKVCIAENGKMKVVTPDTNQEPVETVVFGASLLEFDAEIDARNQFEQITTYGWNPAEQEVITAEANAPNISLNGNLSASELAQVMALENLQLKHGGNINPTVLQEWSDAKSLFQKHSKCRGNAKFQGIASVKPGTVIQLEGVGDRFNGKVFVSAVRHEIAKGNWTANVQFGINPKWFSETYDISSMPAAGLVPTIQGLHTGIVTQLENDPDGEERIMVKIPIINQIEQGIWARLASIDAGENRGTIFRPDIGDEVILGFINNDPNCAVVLGVMHSSNKPAPIPASDDNFEKGFITKSELKFLFDDDKKSVLIETPGGKKICVDDDADTIEINDGSNKVVLSSDGILMESSSDINIKASGDVNIEGINVNVAASANLVSEGGAGAEISSGGNTVVKGSIVQIN